MNRHQTNQYLLQHGVKLPNGQIFLDKPLYVFKKVWTYDILSDFKVKNVIGKTQPVQYTDFIRGKLKREIEQSYNSVSAVANMIIPVGTIINPAQDYECKLRAERAFVWNIIRIHDKKEVFVARSAHDLDYMYYPASPQGVNLSTAKQAMNDVEPTDNYYLSNISAFSKAFVVPKNQPFIRNTRDCAAGIHFFAEQKLAVSY